ncbi:MAG: hypothetical protein GY851_21085 [bacterium]|nr:hypothetical protein [bacterium]
MSWCIVSQQGTAEHRKHGFHSAQPDSGLGALMAYLRKYLAKEDSPDRDHPYRGRRWATSRLLPTEPYARIDLSRTQAVLLRRMARRLLKSRFRGQKGRKLRVSLMTGDEYITVYANWTSMLRWMEYHDVWTWTPELAHGIPFDDPHV